MNSRLVSNIDTPVLTVGEIINNGRCRYNGSFLEEGADTERVVPLFTRLKRQL